MSEKDHIDHPHQLSYHAMDDPRRHPPQIPSQMRSGAARIMMERHRVIFEEGFTPEHDAEHEVQELEGAANAYITAAVYAQSFGQAVPRSMIDNVCPSWPFEPEAFKPSDDPVRNLEKAGQFVAAAIDRIEADL